MFEIALSRNVQLIYYAEDKLIAASMTSRESKLRYAQAGVDIVTDSFHELRLVVPEG